ncbi:interleukin-12 receptor subunit beta-2 [Aix galericulata]|nr:interleukin-12 receptor subunit beta-2 [Aix galericulata]
MTANSASHVQPGTNITLSCQLKQLKYNEQCKIAIFFNSSELIINYGTSVSTKFPVLTYGKHMFTCKIVCEYKKKLICGVDIMSGNGTDIFCFLEENLSNKFGSLVLSKKLNFDSTYTVVVAASNELGSAFSQPLMFMLIDIVKPHPPRLLVEFENSVTNFAFVWHDEVRAQHCRIRYRPLTGYAWNTVENVNSENFSLYGLEPHTEYEFQVSCKIHPERGLWSNWSAFQTQTPEAVPTGLLDVWYKMQDVDSQTQNISLFWKALSKSEAKGRILQYTVTFEALNRGGSKAEVTTQTSYTRTTAKMDYRISVTADNSRGSSPPAVIMTDLGIRDLPPPQKVSAIPMGNGSIFVSWEPPDKSTVFINGYVVEWMDTHRKKSLAPPPTWIKLVASNLSTVISEHIKDNVCYDISVFALYQDRAGQVASVRGYSREKAPSAGPQMYTTPQTNGVLVSWEDIPSHQQMGCITAYNIYLRKKDSEVAPAVYAISNTTSQREFYITNLQRGENYILWMTASTAAGESPWGNRELVCLESAVDWLIVVLTCSFFVFSVCVCSMRPARKVLYSLLSATVPQWHNKAIPDPANATWAKSYAAVKGELSMPSSLFLRDTSSFEEPETIEVEEGFTKTDSQIFHDKLIFGKVHGRENHDWQSESSFGKQEPEYKALPSTTDGDSYDHQLPYLYRRMAEVTGQTQTASEYLANPIADRAPGYLPAGIPAPATDTAAEQQELECSPISVFPTTFLTPVFSYGGKVYLDTVRLNCSSFARVLYLCLH